jgi:hypothetical protein
VIAGAGFFMRYFWLNFGDYYFTGKRSMTRWLDKLV